MRGRCVNDPMDGIETQTINMKITKPHEGIITKEATHLTTVRIVKINAFTPGGGKFPGKIRREFGQIISRWPDMIINDVQDDSQAASVTGIHEFFKIIWRAQGMMRREQIHAIVAPAVITGILDHWHQFDMRNAKRHQVLQPLNR